MRFLTRHTLWVVYPVLVILSLRALTLDMSRFRFQELDILSLIDPWSFAYLLLLSSCFAYTLMRGDRTELRLATFSVFSVLCITYFLAQLPLLAYWDYYLHASTAKLIQLESHVSFKDYQAYPMSFLLTAMTSLITSSGILQSMQLLFYAGQVLSFIVIYVYTRRYRDERRKAVVVVLATYFVLSYYRHFSPEQYALPLFLLLISPWLTESNIGRWRLVCMVLLALAIVMGHVITSLFVLGVFSALFLFRRVSVRMGLLIGTIFLGWQALVGDQWFDMSTRYFYETMILGKGPFVSIARAAPFLGLFWSLSPQVFALTAFKWVSFGAIGTLGFLFALRHRSDSYMKTIGAILIGLLIGGTLLSASFAGWIERLVAPLFLLCLLAIAHAMPCSTKKAPRSLFILAILLVPAFVAAHPPFMIFSVHPYEYQEFVHEWEIHVGAFINAYGQTVSKGGHAIVSTDMQTYFVYRFFDPYSDPYSDARLVSPYSDFNSLVALSPTVFDGDIIVRSARQEIISSSYSNVDLSLWHQVDTRLSETYLRIYSNGRASVYAGSKNA